MTSSSDDNGDRKRTICTELDELRRNLREVDKQMRDVIKRVNARELLPLFIRRRAAYLKRETELQNELENKYNLFYHRYL
ncbi:hypothetical protein RND71_036179 [Anisodus tanguticus]|uniref:Uncharacterized protein n=1 Tax=Anisodus tanguticus TaxID=243964 RepID=A0AAE1R6L1_9SOLA|nr:hypothetical protein RND71_036179 [Anisodus tanguticus]